MSDIELKQKQNIINAFKGYITTHKLEPSRNKEDTLYIKSNRAFSDEMENGFRLHYRRKEHSRVIYLFEQTYPNQIDRTLVSNLMLDILSAWVTEGDELSDQNQLEEAGENLINQVESKIETLLLFLPIEGLEIEGNDSFVIGNCTLHPNYKDTDFMQVIQQNNALYSQTEDLAIADEKKWLKRVNSYFTCKITAHPNQAMKRGREESNIALDILRLFLSSYYFDEYVATGVVRQMGLYGSLKRAKWSRILYIDPATPLADQRPGGLESRTILQQVKINRKIIGRMEKQGLHRINRLAQSTEIIGAKMTIVRRLTVAITWFAKATNVKNAASDSYFMYAIAIEALLSSGRTSREDYAIQIAALVVSRESDSIIYPIGGYLSSQFARQLKEEITLNDGFNAIRKRVLQLFAHRNKIAHGGMLDSEIQEADLLDFETLVRNSILSFIKKDWNTFEDFKAWVDESVGLQFTL